MHKQTIRKSHFDSIGHSSVKAVLFNLGPEPILEGSRVDTLCTQLLNLLYSSFE